MTGFGMTVLVSWPLHAACAGVCALVAVLIWATGRRGLTTWLLGGACAALAAWAAAAAIWPLDAPLHGLAGVLELVRSCLWCALLLHLHERERSGPGGGCARGSGWAAPCCSRPSRSFLPPRPSPGIPSPARSSRPRPSSRASRWRCWSSCWPRTSTAAPGEAARWHVNLPCIALGGLGAFDLVLYVEAVLARRFSPILLDARAALTMLAARPARSSRRCATAAGAAGRRSRARRCSTAPRWWSAAPSCFGVGAAGRDARAASARSWGRDRAGEPAGRRRHGAGGGAGLALGPLADAPLPRRSLLHRPLRLPPGMAALHRRPLRPGRRRLPAAVRAVRAIADAVDSPAGVLLLREDRAAPAAFAGPAPGTAPPCRRPTLGPCCEALGAGERVARAVARRCRAARGAARGLRRRSGSPCRCCTTATACSAPSCWRRRAPPSRWTRGLRAAARAGPGGGDVPRRAAARAERLADGAAPGELRRALRLRRARREDRLRPADAAAGQRRGQHRRPGVPARHADHRPRRAARINTLHRPPARAGGRADERRRDRPGAAACATCRPASIAIAARRAARRWPWSDAAGRRRPPCGRSPSRRR